MNKLYEALTKKESRHGKCTDWIRENRRRRAAGLPQKRNLGAYGVFDPVARTVTRTIAGGAQEVLSV